MCQCRCVAAALLPPAGPTGRHLLLFGAICNHLMQHRCQAWHWSTVVISNGHSLIMRCLPVMICNWCLPSDGCSKWTLWIFVVQDGQELCTRNKQTNIKNSLNDLSLVPVKNKPTNWRLTLSMLSNEFLSGNDPPSFLVYLTEIPLVIWKNYRSMGSLTPWSVDWMYHGWNNSISSCCLSSLIEVTSLIAPIAPNWGAKGIYYFGG